MTVTYTRLGQRYVHGGMGEQGEGVREPQAGGQQETRCGQYSMWLNMNLNEQ